MIEHLGTDVGTQRRSAVEHRCRHPPGQGIGITDDPEVVEMTVTVVDDVIDYFVNNNKLVAAICAAPMLLGRRGYLKDQNYTVHPGFEINIIGGRYLRSQGVVRSNRFITGKSMYYSIELGLEIVEYYYGHEEKEKLRLSLKGE